VQCQTRRERDQKEMSHGSSTGFHRKEAMVWVLLSSGSHIISRRDGDAVEHDERRQE